MGPARARALGSRFFALAALALAVGQPSFARADPSASDRATARRLFAEGLERRRARDLAGALARFRAADSLMGVPTTALELGRVEMELGLLVEAHESLMRAARWSGPPPLPKAFSRAQDEAERLLEALRPRLPTVRVALGPALEDARYRVVLDGHVVPREAIAQPYAVNPGHHTLALEREGQRVRELGFDVREGVAENVDLTPPAELAVAARPTTPASTASPPPATVAPSSPPTSSPPTSLPPTSLPREGGSSAASTSRLSSPLVITGLVLAGAGLTVGATAGAVTLAKRSDIEAACPDAKCEPPAQPTLDAAWTASTVADVGFVTAGVGVAVALTAWLWPRSPSSPSTAPSAASAAASSPSASARPTSPAARASSPSAAPFVAPWVGGVRGFMGGFVF